MRALLWVPLFVTLSQPVLGKDWTPRKSAASRPPASAGVSGLGPALSYAKGRADGTVKKKPLPEVLEYARTLLAEDRPAEAANLLREVLGPQAPGPGKVRTRALAVFVEALEATGMLSRFRSDLPWLKDRQTDIEELRILLGVTLSTGDLAGAEETADRILAIRPSDPTAARILATLRPSVERSGQRQTGGRGGPGRSIPEDASGPSTTPQTYPDLDRALEVARRESEFDSAWRILVAIGNPDLARKEAVQASSDEIREAGIARIAWAVGDIPTARQALARGASMIRSVGQPDEFAVASLLRLAIALRQPGEAASLASIALLRCNGVAAHQAAVAAASMLRGTQDGLRLLDQLAAAPRVPGIPMRDSLARVIASLVSGAASGAIGDVSRGRILVPALEAALRTDSPDVRGEVIDAISRLARPAVLYRVLRRLSEDGESLDAAEMAALGRMRNNDLIAAMSAQYDRLSPLNRVAAVLIAARNPGQAAAPLLLRASRDVRVPAAAEIAAIAAGASGDPAVVPTLQSVRSSPVPAVADAAALGLALAGTNASPETGGDCTDTTAGRLLLTAVSLPKDAAVRKVLACAFRPGVSEDAIVAALAAADDPAAWRGRTKEAIATAAREAVDSWPIPDKDPGWMTSVIVQSADRMAAARTLAGFVDELGRNGRVALSSEEPARMLRVRVVLASGGALASLLKDEALEELVHRVEGQ